MFKEKNSNFNPIYYCKDFIIFNLAIIAKDKLFKEISKIDFHQSQRNLINSYYIKEKNKDINNLFNYKNIIQPYFSNIKMQKHKIKI